MRRPPGTTLTELLVVTMLFSILMVLILGFYIEGSRVTSRQDRYSASYRRVLQVLDRLSTLLGTARIYHVQADQIVFSPLPARSPLTLGRPDWGPMASTLLVQTSPPALILREGGATRTFLELQPWDGVSFGASGTGALSVTATSRPPLQAGEGQARTIQATRRILLENDGIY